MTRVFATEKMKTTGGKTKSVRPEARAIHIYAEGARGLIAVRRASSLRQALLEYNKETLVKQGCTKPKVIGNTLTVTDKQQNAKVFVALETYQEHILT